MLLYLFLAVYLPSFDLLSSFLFHVRTRSRDHNMFIRLRRTVLTRSVGLFMQVWSYTSLYFDLLDELPHKLFLSVKNLVRYGAEWAAFEWVASLQPVAALVIHNHFYSRSQNESK